ncbi:MAG: hypothetical protein D9V47_06270 [Clostridia bacterium]|nr:MAG: hypothetical protein D9V47_06270 [Clostridia bacterium]
MATELKRLLKEIKGLNPEEREKLKRLLDKQSADDHGDERFERAAGSWGDLDEEEFTAQTYANRIPGLHIRSLEL